MAETQKPKSVYAKIAAVQGALAKVGISKDRKNLTPGQNYNFRGIDEVYNTLSPLMSEHGLCILPRIISREVSTRQSKNGGTLFCVTVEAEFDFVSADDGSIHVVKTYGEAMDSSDKATNKAMSAAYKYAALMTFAIPTEGDNDADAHTHEVVASPRQTKAEPTGPVDDGQWMVITDLIEKTGTDAGKFCAAFKIKSVKELPAAQFERAQAMLAKKLADMGNAQ